MTLEQAKEILRNGIQMDDWESWLKVRTCFDKKRRQLIIYIADDGEWTADELEAIATWMRAQEGKS